MNQNDKNKMMDEILKNSNGKLDTKAIKDAAKKGDTEKLINSLKDEDKQKLLNVLSNQDALNEILKSPQAQAMLKLFGGKNGWFNKTAIGNFKWPAKYE